MTPREEYVRILAALIHANACGTAGTPEAYRVKAIAHLEDVASLFDADGYPKNEGGRYDDED